MRGFQVRALGEIAIRCRDLDAMAAFYRDVLGLEVLKTFEGIVFFRFGESHGGHTQVLALFGPGADTRPGLHPEAEPGPGALHHLALALPAEEQAAAEAWLRAQGCPVRTEHFDWIGWRGLFTRDPEGNTVELVAKLLPGM